MPSRVCVRESRQAAGGNKYLSTPHAERYAERHVHPADANTNTLADAHAHADPHTHQDAYTEANADSPPHAHEDAHANTDAERDAHAARGIVRTGHTMTCRDDRDQRSRWHSYALWRHPAGVCAPQFRLHCARFGSPSQV